MILPLELATYHFPTYNNNAKDFCDIVLATMGMFVQRRMNG